MIAEMMGQISPRMIVGTAIGFVGAAVATYWEIAKLSEAGPRVRAFMVRACVLFWVWNCLFVAAVLLVPKPQNWLAVPVYSVPLLIGARYCNRRSVAIQGEDWCGMMANQALLRMAAQRRRRRIRESVEGRHR